MNVVNNRLPKICGLFMVLFVFTLRPAPAVQAAANVEDWLKENNNQQEEKEDTTTPIDEENTSMEGSDEGSASLFIVIVKMIFALLLVLGLIYVLLQFLKKKNKLFLKSNTLENIGGITVGSNKSMQIIRIGSRFFVIGVGENVDILHEITDQEVVQGLLEKDDEQNLPTKHFLSSIMPGKSTGQKVERNFKQLFSRELRNLKQNRKKIINENKEDTHE